MKKKEPRNFKKMTTTMNEYTNYNQHFEVLICRICKTDITGIHRHFARNHQSQISLKIRKEIDEYIKNLNLQSIEYISNPIQEIEAIEGIEITEGFKCITESRCRKVFDIENSIESHCRNIHNWNTAKDNTYYLID
jgi:hypothetical protein